jgi:hypothetical protein
MAALDCLHLIVIASDSQAEKASQRSHNRYLFCTNMDLIATSSTSVTAYMNFSSRGFLYLVPKPGCRNAKRNNSLKDLRAPYFGEITPDRVIRLHHT